MGIFINSSLFEFEINFDELLIQDVLVGIKVSNQGKSKLICKAKGRDFDTMSKILEGTILVAK